jgi:hypothetical protein
MPAGCFLGKHRRAIYRYLEQSARGLHQAHVGIRKGTVQFSRQTGSSRLVVSDNAVLNCDEHFS